MECYRYEVIKYENAPYKGIIDAVYVLTMDNSSRHKSIYSQLNTFHGLKSTNSLVNTNPSSVSSKENILLKKLIKSSD